MALALTRLYVRSCKEEDATKVKCRDETTNVGFVVVVFFFKKQKFFFLSLKFSDHLDCLMQDC